MVSPQKSDVSEQTLKHIGFVNFSDFYDFCYQWFLDEEYFLTERLYKEKLSDAGKEIRIKWKATKNVTDYFRNVIEIKWHILGLNEVEIERNGQKEKTNKVKELRMDFDVDLEKDYEHKWEDKPLYKFFRGIYDRYIMRTTTDEYEIRLQKKALSLIKEIKSYLQLEGNS